MTLQGGGAVSPSGLPMATFAAWPFWATATRKSGVIARWSSSDGELLTGLTVAVSPTVPAS
jgi:hypothetical protein